MKSFFAFLSILFFSSPVYCQKLPTEWEELTASDFPLAVRQSGGVCVIPMGVIEKHGNHLPLGTDVYTAREICQRAAEKEYCIIYPYYFAGQIFEAQHQPGTIAYSPELIFKVLEETCKEISRNGIKKIILVNTHGGNNSFLQYFCQTQLATPRDYVVYSLRPTSDAATQEKIRAMRKTTVGGHADEDESSSMMAIHPDLVKIERATSESGANQNNLQHIGSLNTGIKWYSQYPNHYAGDAKDANPALGEVSIEGRAVQLAGIIKTVKADPTTLRLQNEFFRESQSPLTTKTK